MMVDVLQRHDTPPKAARPRQWLRGLALCAMACISLPSLSFAQASWASAGGLYNSHGYVSPQANVGSPTQITPGNVKRLALKWSFNTKLDISATPAVEPGGLYVPDWSGAFYKINPDTGALIWQHSVCEYDGTCGSKTVYSWSRSSPAIGNNVVVIGDYAVHPTGPNPGARVFGINKATGKLAWITPINSTSLYANVLGSAVIYNNIVYVGTASADEGKAHDIPGYIPVFRGNVTALNADTGAIIWQFTTVPPGYSGGPAPGSNMVVWPAHNALILSTGNNYQVPASVAQCAVAAGKNVAAQFACMDPTNYVDAILSLDLTTGHLNWSRLMHGFDNWDEACDYSPQAANCQTPVGRDSDFAQMPMLTYVPNFTGVRDDRGGLSANYIIGDGEKDSNFYALNPVNGGLYWTTQVGIGGMEWGSTVNINDFNMFYFALHNPLLTKQTIAGQVGRGPVTWNAGAWGGLDIRTGAIKWMVPTVGADLVNPASGGVSPGCMSFANRLVFAGSSSGVFVALDANTGAVDWTYQSAGTVVSCPAIYNETLYWGTGYARSGVGAHTLYAFAVPPPAATK